MRMIRSVLGAPDFVFLTDQGGKVMQAFGA